MTDYFSNQGGTDWSNSAMWTPPGVPGANDRVTINHSGVTVTDSRVFGTSSDPSIELTINHPGSLIISAPFEARGEARAFGAASWDAITIQPGGSWRFNSSNHATSPLTTQYRCIMGSANGEMPRVLINGTAQSRITVDSEAGGGQGYFSMARDGRFKFSYTDLTNIGDATNYGIRMGNYGELELDNVRFLNSGGVYLTGNLIGSRTFHILNSNFAGTLSPYAVYFVSGSNTTQGFRQIKDCAFDRALYFITPRTIELEGCYCRAGFVTTAVDAASVFSWKFNLYRKESVASPFSLRGDQEDCLFWVDSSDFNPHFVQVGNTTVALTRCFGYANTTDVGDIGDFVQINSNNGHVVLRNCVIMRCPGRHVGAATLSTQFQEVSVPNQSMDIEHCTMIGRSSLPTVGENGNSPTGALANLRSNLYVPSIDDPDQSGLQNFIRDLTGTQDNVLTPENATHNGGLGAAGRYPGQFPGTQPGANDILGTLPVLVRQTTLGDLDNDWGGDGTDLNFDTELSKMNAADWNPQYSVRNAIHQLKLDHRVTTPEFQGTAHDFGDVGAFEFIETPPEQAIYRPFAAGVFR